MSGDERSECKCSFVQFMVGDGCEACNPSLADDFAGDDDEVMHDD